MKIINNCEGGCHLNKLEVYEIKTAQYFEGNPVNYVLDFFI